MNLLTIVGTIVSEIDFIVPDSNDYCQQNKNLYIFVRTTVYYT